MLTGARALALAWALAVSAAAGEAIVVTPHPTADGHVFASFSASGAFTDSVRQAVASGLPMTLAFTVELRRPAAFWFDHTLATTRVASSVQFDNLTRSYLVSKLSDGRVTWSKQTDGEGEMRAWATEFDQVPLNTSEALAPNAEYYVRVQLQISPHRSFPLWPWGKDDASGRADFTFVR